MIIFGINNNQETDEILQQTSVARELKYDKGLGSICLLRGVYAIFVSLFVESKKSLTRNIPIWMHKKQSA